jgi:hypothetical protein
VTVPHWKRGAAFAGAMALGLVLLAAALLPAVGDARADVRVSVTIPVENTGTGTVTGPGITCPGDCKEFLPSGSPVELVGDPETGSELAWGGACAGTPPDQACNLTPTSFTKVIAVFTSVGPGPGGDKTPPKTTITRAPKQKVKTKKSKASVTFEFESDEKKSTFECRLDKDPFKPCESPLKLKAKLGKHTFDVRASDVAENTDDSPATAAFKVVKKKRR